MRAWIDWKVFTQCTDAASKSEMLFKLGAVLVKGGKVISTGHNHHRTHYDGNDVKRKPVSMHAEMHAIFNACVGVLLSITSYNRLLATLQLPANFRTFIPVDSRLTPLH